MLKQEFCLFDFDRTVTKHDSFQLLIVSLLKRQPWRILLLAVFAPLFALTALAGIDKRYAKSAALWSLTFGYGARKCFELLEQILPLAVSLGQTPSGSFWLAKGIQRIKELQQQGCKIVLCTASAEEWVRPLLEAADVHVDFLIGTKISFRFGGVIVVSPNCYHTEKVQRLQPLLQRGTVTESYSDHPSDVPLLNLGAQAFLINPKARHMQQFKRELTVPYQVLNWR